MSPKIVKLLTFFKKYSNIIAPNSSLSCSCYSSSIDSEGFVFNFYCRKTKWPNDTRSVCLNFLQSQKNDTVYKIIAIVGVNADSQAKSFSGLRFHFEWPLPWLALCAVPTRAQLGKNQSASLALWWVKQANLASRLERKKYTVLKYPAPCSVTAANSSGEMENSPESSVQIPSIFIESGGDLLVNCFFSTQQQFKISSFKRSSKIETIFYCRVQFAWLRLLLRIFQNRPFTEKPFSRRKWTLRNVMDLVKTRLSLRGGSRKHSISKAGVNST